MPAPHTDPAITSAATPIADTPFDLHERLAADTLPVADLGLSRLLLMNNRVWPWLILVPRRAGLREIHDLDAAARTVLMEEIAALSALLTRLVPADKINVGMLGNMVPQLHIHVIARTAGDPAWPGPVWGSGHAAPYDADAAAAFIAAVRAGLEYPG